ncbi:hypothetical protein BS329_20205 [Amycolatopsis coloradensis]|uniref:Uncharacterized protein n=1 Tax=Amycolatopsis coloradensis TaxID=76021 RepID=A0A1R0KSI0_9PSEU|nr:hypothetical protein [Amycolatopsis coloradensis]OLZ50724.1 hypothetical protein BS329_20205 [Amycolatopsis coloradensis]
MGSGETVDGDTAVMIQAARSFHNIVQDRPSLMDRAVDPACGNGLSECGPLVQADASATKALQTFVMNVRYGIAAYGAFAQRSGIAYRDADEGAAAGILKNWHDDKGAGLRDDTAALPPAAPDPAQPK